MKETSINANRRPNKFTKEAFYVLGHGDAIGWVCIGSMQLASAKRKAAKLGVSALGWKPKLGARVLLLGTF